MSTDNDSEKNVLVERSEPSKMGVNMEDYPI